MVAQLKVEASVVVTPPLVSIPSEAIRLTVLNQNQLALKGAEVYVPGRPLQYTNNDGQVDLQLVKGLSYMVKVSAAGCVPQDLTIDGLTTPKAVLIKAELLLSGAFRWIESSRCANLS